MRRALILTLAVLALTAADAAAGPCDPTSPTRPPSAALLGTLGVLREPAGPEDRAPRSVRSGEGRPYAGAMRWVPLAVGGGLWVVPLYDVSGRFAPSEACIRTVPRRYRARIRREKRLARNRRPLEGVRMVAHDAGGESLGVAEGGIGALREGSFAMPAGVEDERRTRVVGLVPDGVASVRVQLPARRDERGRPQPAQDARAAVAQNAWGADLDTPFDITFEEPVVTWFDPAGAPVPR